MKRILLRREKVFIISDCICILILLLLKPLKRVEIVTVKNVAVGVYAVLSVQDAFYVF